MSKSGIFKAVITAVIFLAVSSAYGYDDGFGQAKKIETKHFTVYYAPQLDISALADRLNISFSDRILAGDGGSPRDYSTQPDFAQALDTLFLRVGDILDMNLRAFQSTIKICRDNGQLDSIYTHLFNQSLGEGYSFYSHDLNTIYISEEHFKREVLGHEIAHAIISNYFVVQPPVKASEILARYVEYQLRKDAQK
jgi:hypothetical protein